MREPAAGGAQTHTYDPAGRLTGAADPDGAYTLAYDAADRVAHVDEPFGLGLTFAYDPVGNRTGVQDATGGVTTMAFDALDRPTSERVGGAGVAAMRADTAYDAAGQVSTQTRYSDLAGTAVVGTTAYGYDGAGRATGIETTDGTGSVLANSTYAYDTAGRLGSKTEDGATTSYAYDAAGQLTADGTTGFSYDANGNRTMAGYATGAGNRTTTDGTWTYTYDAEGNVSGKTDAAGDAWVYSYDNNNQMVTAAYTPAGSGSATQLVTYSYDAFGNRIQRQAWDGSTTTTQRYGLDGWDTAKPPAVGNENFGTWAVLDGTNALTTRQLPGPDFGAPAAVETAAGMVSWNATDLQGSVRMVLDNSGSVTTTVAYDAFGNTTSGTVPDYGYTGQRLDPITLYYSNGNGTREYDPASGVWMQEDPAGFAAGDSNLRRYVGNGPTDATDPSGLDELTTWRDRAVWKIANESSWRKDRVWDIGQVNGAFVEIDYDGVTGRVSRAALARFIDRYTLGGFHGDEAQEKAAIRAELAKFVMKQGALMSPNPKAVEQPPGRAIPTLTGREADQPQGNPDGWKAVAVAAVAIPAAPVVAEYVVVQGGRYVVVRGGQYALAQGGRVLQATKEPLARGMNYAIDGSKYLADKALGPIPPQARGYAIGLVEFFTGVQLGNRGTCPAPRLGPPSGSGAGSGKPGGTGKPAVPPAGTPPAPTVTPPKVPTPPAAGAPGAPATPPRTPAPGSASYKPDVMMSSRPEKRHGWKWSDEDAKKRAADTGNPQGRWGSKADADHAMAEARYLQPGETTVIDAPPGSKNKLFHPDGTVTDAPRIFIMVRESGVVHAFPVEAGYVPH